MRLSITTSTHGRRIFWAFEQPQQPHITSVSHHSFVQHQLLTIVFFRRQAVERYNAADAAANAATLDWLTEPKKPRLGPGAPSSILRKYPLDQIPRPGLLRSIDFGIPPFILW